MRKLFFAAMLAAMVTSVFGLSEELTRPKVFFPKGFDTNRVEKVQGVLTSTKFKYLTGMTSYWEPEFATTLVYDGDAKSLSEFIAALNDLAGFKIVLTFSNDLAKETGSALAAGSWWVKYRHTAPNTLTVRVNLASANLGQDKFALELLKKE